MTTLASSSFTGTNGAAFGAEWANAKTTSGSTSTIDTNRGKQVTSAVGGYSDYRTDKLSFGTTTDGTLTGTIAVPTTAEAYPQAWFRGESALQNNGYFFSFEPSGSNIQFYKRVSGTQTALGSGTAFTFVANTIYSWKVQWFGTTLRAKVWTGAEPGSWTVSITDSSITAAGVVGLGVDGGSAASAVTVFWDDVLLDDNAVSFAATTIARSVVVPSPTIALGTLVAPAVIARAVVVPAATVSTVLNATVTPAVIARAVVMPAATASAPDARPQPSVVARAVVVPAPVVSLSYTLAVPAIARTVAVPAPQIIRSVVVSPAVIGRPSSVPVPNVDVVSAAPVSLLTDTFSFEDTGKWTGYASANVSATLGQLNIVPAPSYDSLVSTADFSLNSSEAYVEFVQPPNVGTGTTSAGFFMEWGTNRIGFYYDASGVLVFQERVTGVDSLTNIAFDPVAHRWWKFGKTGTTLTWFTSPDGITWTSRRTKTTTLNPNLAKVFLYSGYFGTEPTPGVAKFDNLNTPAIVVTPDVVPVPDTGWWLEAYDLNDGSLQARVYDFTKASFLDPIGEVGLGSIELSRTAPSISEFDEFGVPNILPNGFNATTLYTKPYYWRVFDNGAPRFRFITEVNDKQIAKEDHNDSVSLTGPGHSTVLSWGVCLPSNLTAAATSRVFLGTNWANVWLTLFHEAQTRGAIPAWVTPTFDQYIDSNGVAWVDYGDYEVKPGVSLLSLLNTFQGNIGFQWRMDVNGFLVVAMNYGVDRSDTVRFFEGHDIWEAEDHIVGSDVKSDVFVEGGDGFVTAASDTTTRTDWGHRELYVQASNAIGDLAGSIFAQGTLSQVRKAVLERNFKIDPFPVDDAGVSLGRRVYVDYGPGDLVGYNGSMLDGSTDFRLISIAVDINSDGTVTQEITVNSRREALAERIRRILEQSLNGNYSAAQGSPNDVVGGSTTLDEAIGDALVPDVPTFASITSTSALADNGIEQAQVSIVWYQPTNTDLTPIIDGDHYELGYRLLGVGDYQVNLIGWDSLQATIEGLTPNSSYQFRIRAVDKANPANYGAWSAPTTHVTVIDTAAPPTPAAPSCAANLISVQITHTLGLSSGGTYNLPHDLDHFEVHAGTVFNFAVSPSTLIGKLAANKGMIVAGIPAIGTFTISSTALVYYKVVAVDKTGNRSADSGSASATATLIDSTHVSSITASQITAGTISAAVILAGSIKTATSGQRAEFDVNGFRLYNPSGGNTVNLDAVTGSASITGIYQSNSAGQRIVIDASGNGTIYFYPSSGSDYAFINSPASNSVGVNSGNGGGANSTRVFLTPTLGQMIYIVQSTQAKAGGEIQVNSSGAQLSALAGDQIDVFIPGGGGISVNTGVTITANTGVSMTSGSGASATVRGSSGTSITTLNGQARCSSDNGDAILGAPNNNYFWAQSGSVSVNCGSGNISISGGSTVSMSGSSISISGTGNATVNGNSTAHLTTSGCDVSLTTTTVRISCTAYQTAGVVSTSFAANGYYDTVSWQWYYSTSSRKVKEVIETADSSSLISGLMKLRPVTFYDKREYDELDGDITKQRKQLGLIAEEVDEIPELAEMLVRYNRTDDGEMLPSVAYERGFLVLLPLVLDMNRRLKELETAR